MDIQRIDWQDGELDVRTLVSLVGKDAAVLQVGIATFPPGIRSPAEGLTAHEHTEVSVILEGEFQVELADGPRSVRKDDLVVIPAGEGHASTALTNARVFYILFG